MILLQAAMGLAVILFLVLGLGVLIGVPSLVYIAIQRNKNFDNYDVWLKLCFITIAAIVSFLLVVFVIWGLFSMIDMSIT